MVVVCILITENVGNAVKVFWSFTNPESYQFYPSVGSALYVSASSLGPELVKLHREFLLKAINSEDAYTSGKLPTTMMMFFDVVRLGGGFDQVNGDVALGGIDAAIEESIKGSHELQYLYGIMNHGMWRAEHGYGDVYSEGLKQFIDMKDQLELEGSKSFAECADQIKSERDESQFRPVLSYLFSSVADLALKLVQPNEYLFRVKSEVMSRSCQDFSLEDISFNF